LEVLEDGSPKKRKKRGSPKKKQKKEEIEDDDPEGEEPAPEEDHWNILSLQRVVDYITKNFKKGLA
jgi:hypothetical protein